MADDNLLTTTQAGAILYKSPRTVQRMADRGELQHEAKLPGPNGAYLFRESVVRAKAAA